MEQDTNLTKDELAVIALAAKIGEVVDGERLDTVVGALHQLIGHAILSLQDDDESLALALHNADNARILVEMFSPKVD